LLDAGFEFGYPALGPALDELETRLVARPSCVAPAPVHAT
jgi:hypothetical protein